MSNIKTRNIGIVRVNHRYLNEVRNICGANDYRILWERPSDYLEVTDICVEGNIFPEAIEGDVIVSGTLEITLNSKAGVEEVKFI